MPGATARLVAGSGLQFIEFEIPTDVLSLTYCRFIEECDTTDGPMLIPLEDRPDYEGVEWHPATNRALRPEETLWLTGYGGIEPFLGTWLPVPYLRHLARPPAGTHRYDGGPTNWARIFLTAPEGGLRQATRLQGVAAFDTRLSEAGRLDDDAYLAPSVDDMRLGSEFHLVSDPTALAGLLSEKWFDVWLAQAFAAWQAREADPGSVTPPTGSFALEHIARYLTLLRTLDRAAGLPPVRFFDVHDDRRPAGIGVDLVVDVDDDRTTALLVDRMPVVADDHLAGVERLQLRELTAPSRVHRDPFRTFGEFDRPDFGNAVASRLSGRPDAFYWPSLMRIGDEAQRLSMRVSAVPGLTGLGSLRSMLDETSARAASWRFSRDDFLGADPGPVVAGEVMAHLAEDGEVLSDGRIGTPPALRPRFSASSLVSMFFAELILHALSQVNATALRSVDGEIRHLQQVVVTCPAEASEDERRLLVDRVTAGIDLVWSSFGWPTAGTPVTPAKPRAALGLDRGLASQLLYLHDEVHDRFGGNMRHVMGLARGSDGASGGSGGMTIASLDLASTSTGLAIVDYALGAEAAVHPRVVLADRSFVSAHSLTGTLLTDVILPAIARDLGKCGHPHPSAFIEGLLSGATETNSGPHFAARLEHRILRPAAEALLEQCRDSVRGAGRHGLEMIPLATLVGLGHGRLQPLAADIEEVAGRQGARGFSLGTVGVALRPRSVAALVSDQLDPLVARLAEIVREQSCDLLLLSGPFAHTSWVRSLLLRRLPLAPHQILDLGERRVGIIDGLSATTGIDGRGKLRLQPLVGLTLAGRAVLGTMGLALLPPGPGAPQLAAPRRAGLSQIGRADRARLRLTSAVGNRRLATDPESAVHPRPLLVEELR